ncbi:MAG: sulfur carrier protein ThiS [Cellvibrionaceae bacterium]|nr:sulfur carrier protein ThiS [Cellvibrionaceae bacterium]
MIQLSINGETHVVKQANLLTVLQGLPVPEQSFAIAVNETFIPQSAYAATELSDGDRIELLVPMQGG